MIEDTANDGDSLDALLLRSRNGDEAAWGEVLVTQQERLLRMVRLRLDPRLSRRIDPADVVQESFVQATKRRTEFFRLQSMPFFVWLRLLTVQKLAELHRHHFGVQARDAAREVSMFAPVSPATSAVLAARLLGQTTTPSQQAVRHEVEQRVREVLDGMDDVDREIIALRNFEQLSNIEAASVLRIGASTASSRYIRALKKLRAILGEMSAFEDEQGPSEA